MPPAFPALLSTRRVLVRRYRVAPADPAAPSAGLEVAAAGAWHAIVAAAPRLGRPPQECFAVPA